MFICCIYFLSYIKSIKSHLFEDTIVGVKQGFKAGKPALTESLNTYRTSKTLMSPVMAQSDSHLTSGLLTENRGRESAESWSKTTMEIWTWRSLCGGKIRCYMYISIPGVNLVELSPIWVHMVGPWLFQMQAIPAVTAVYHVTLVGLWRKITVAYSWTSNIKGKIDQKFSKSKYLTNYDFLGPGEQGVGK